MNANQLFKAKSINLVRPVAISAELCDAELDMISGGIQETQMSFNLQYVQLQSPMQHENRSYTAVTNIMKTKHDTVKNSISNVR